MNYEPVIGLEVHAQLKTKTKAFCSCPNVFGENPNDQVCPVCLGMPGVLPVLNEKAVELAIRAGIALNCKIADSTKFDRKNYFYPDLPKGYQISQFDQPICGPGHLTIQGKKVRINRAHLEEDAGKLVHAGADGLHGSDYSLVDYNRSGVPLLEIVTEPDIESADLARDYLTELRNILRYLEVCDGNLEEGSFRCDANVSVRPVGATELGTKTEIKNMNSFRSVQKAINSEIERQIKILESGGKITQESRLWDDNSQTTHSMRSKEEAHDYRYFPEPDLVPLQISPERIEAIASSMPELPEARRQRYLAAGLSEEYAVILTESKEKSDFFDQTLALGTPALAASGILINDTEKILRDNNLDFSQARFTAQNIKDVVDATASGQVGSTAVKNKILPRLITEGGNVTEIIEKEGLAQISDESAIKQHVEEILARSQEQVESYRSGKTKVRQFFFGEVMKATRGKANPKVINELLDQLLPEPEQKQ